jgi:co-chaperonin GroES (HSP10)
MTKLIKPERFSQEDNEDALNIPKGPKEIEEYIKKLPNPVGYRLLIRPWSGHKKTKGGILLSEQTQENIQMTTVVGVVIKMGDLCYQDKTKFPTGPWCKEGQFIVYGRYAGARFKTKYGEHRILNDDEIIGTIEKPEDILALF